MNTAFENKVLRAQILILEAERLIDTDAVCFDPELRETLAAIAEKSTEILARVEGGARPKNPQIENHQHNDEEVLTYEAAAKYLQVSRSTVSQYVHKRQIPFRRLGGGRKGAVRFVRSELDMWLRNGTTPARQKL